MDPSTETKEPSVDTMDPLKELKMLSFNPTEPSPSTTPPDSPIEPPEVPFSKRLKMFRYNSDDCLAAIRAKRVPVSLGLTLNRLCIVRGIRYQTKPVPAELEFGRELYGVDPVFSRALNARRIMSNSLDLLPAELPLEETPYCIWYPKTASEATYRELVFRYPQMKYQVGRACAVANYFKLYCELDILPDVHIAEEARDCGNIELYELIVNAPARFDVMNDYELSINEKPKVADLNGDTAVCWTLDHRQKFSSAKPDNDFILDDVDEDYDGECVRGRGYEKDLFNITEDMCIDEYEYPKYRHANPRYDLASLLSAPLPRDLPTTEKNLLILMAAHDGNIDRYVRLRRPKMSFEERICCVRGIYHNTQFALWWSRQGEKCSELTKAINARLIMNNVLSTMNESTPKDEIPYLIWYPVLADKSTYQELYRRQPAMAPQILRACIAGGFKNLFDQILAETIPDSAVRHEAEAKGRHAQYYEEQILLRASKLEITPTLPNRDSWKRYGTAGLDRSHNTFSPCVSEGDVNTFWDSLYNGRCCDAGSVDFITSLPEDWKRDLAIRDKEEGGPIELDYGFSRFQDHEIWDDNPSYEATGSTD